ncbi:MAG: NAD(P)-binding protein, partial [Candidatus Freyrarchaeum guaymaensis]
MKWDVVVVGSGFGGLTCGALLARDGLRVLLLEREDRLGGRATSFRGEEVSFPN